MYFAFREHSIVREPVTRRLAVGTSELTTVRELAGYNFWEENIIEIFAEQGKVNSITEHYSKRCSQRSSKT